MDSQCDPKGGLEPAENGMALRATYTQHKQYKQDTPRARENPDPESEQEADEAVRFLAGSGNVNICNSAWARGYYLERLREYQKTRPDVPRLSLWKETCTDASASGKGSAWLKKVFEARVSEYNPARARAAPAKGGSAISGNQIANSQQRTGGVKQW